MPGEPSFFEIGVPDARRARAFYAALFDDWDFHPTRDNDAWIATSAARGGLHDKDAESRIQLYFRVADIEAAVRRVRELGGEAGEPGPERDGFGRFASCHDDQGVAFGLHQPPRDASPA